MNFVWRSITNIFTSCVWSTIYKSNMATEWNLEVWLSMKLI